MRMRIVGAVAQLGERYVRNVEVRGSIPLGSTIPPQPGGNPDFLYTATDGKILR